jgi:nitrite reductase/ring-hydroxylating ferredoxin subunit
MHWIPATLLSVLEPGQVRTVKHGRARIAVFRLADGAVRACDDRCPHEGYPLSQGTVAGAVLTCQYHNYKFDLTDGACLMGEEPVAVVPVRIEGDQVYVDVAEPDRSEEVPRRWRSLDAALDDRRIGQAARDAVRLLALGVAPAEIAAHAAARDGARAEYGATHALPVAAEALRLVPHLPGMQAARALAPALELAAESTSRRPEHSPGVAVDPGPRDGFTERLRAAVEAEDAATADALIRGAVRAGFERDVLEPALLRIVSDHLLDYGHGLIYTVKAFDLLDAPSLRGSGPAQAEAILSGLVRELVTATREDLVPTWAPWRRRMAELADELPSFAASRGGLPDREAAVADLVDASPRESVERVLALLRSGVAPAALTDALSLAAAERLLRFDPAHDADVAIQDGWLDVTHLQTFAAAIRDAWARCDHPDLVRLPFQAARLVARVRPLDGPRADVTPREGSTRELVDAIGARDAARAVGLAAGMDPAAVRWPLAELALDPPMTLPIFVAHAIKLVLAACDEASALGDNRPLAGAVRFLASPLRERRVSQRVSEAIALVADGRPPRVLAI